MTITFGNAVHEAAKTPGFLETIGLTLASSAFLIGFAVIAFIIMAVLLENELEGWATTIFSVATAFFVWHFKSDLLAFISTSPLQTLGFVSFYIISGIA